MAEVCDTAARALQGLEAKTPQFQAETDGLEDGWRMGGDTPD